MCSSSSPSPAPLMGKLVERQQRTWCVERAERTRLIAASSVNLSSGDESDSLPDLLSLSDTEDESTDSMLDPRKERHFLDVIAGKIKHRSDRISAEKQAGSEPTQPENVVVLRYPELPVKNKKLQTSKNQWTHEPVDTTDTEEFEVHRKKFKNTRVTFLRNHITIPTEDIKNCREFSQLQEMLLEAARDDDHFDPFLFSHCLDLLSDFSVTRKPTGSIMKILIKNGLYHQDSLDVALSVYRSVVTIWTKYPDLVEFDWTLMVTAADVVNRAASQSSVVNRAASQSSMARREGEPSLIQARLYFALGVFGLRHNLNQCVLADPKSVCTSLAAKNLSVDHFQAVRQVTHWLGCCLVAAEQDCGVSAGADVCVAELNPWIWSLQELLDMSILVSRDRMEASKRLANEILRTYIYLPSLKEKRKLLQTTHSPLLIFCSVRLVLENYCAETLPSSSFPESMHDLTHMYYPALPPRSPITPPPSPSDEEEAAMDGQNSVFSAENCEELCMLIYFITSSYISCRQRRLHRDLRQQVLKGPDYDCILKEDREELRMSAKELEAHLQDLTSELSPRTMVYLTALEAICYAS